MMAYSLDGFNVWGDMSGDDIFGNDVDCLYYPLFSFFNCVISLFAWFFALFLISSTV